MHFGRRKFRSKMRNKQTFPLYGVGFAVYGDLPGRDLERGIKTSRLRVIRLSILSEALDMLKVGSATPCTTYGGAAELKSPRGEHRRPTLWAWPFGEVFLALGFLGVRGVLGILGVHSASRIVPKPAQNVEKLFPNPPKSSLERPQAHQNRPRATTNAARNAKCGQETPKSEK